MGHGETSTQKPVADALADALKEFQIEHGELQPSRDHSWWVEVGECGLDDELVRWASVDPNALVQAAVDGAKESDKPEDSLFYLYTAWTALRQTRSLEEQGMLVRKFRGGQIKGLDEFGGNTLLKAFDALIEAESPSPRASALGPLAGAVEAVVKEYLPVTAWKRSQRMVDLAQLETGDLSDQDKIKVIQRIESAFKEERERPEQETPQLQAESLAREARFLSLPELGRQTDALRLLNQAIAKDRPRDASDEALYAIRVAGYEQMAALIRISISNEQVLDRKIENLKEAQAKAVAELENNHGEMRKDTLQLLGLLAAVIAFIVTSVEFATKYEASEAGALLLLAAGAILFVFLGFSVMFGGKPPRHVLWVGLGIGALLMVLASVLGEFKWI